MNEKEKKFAAIVVEVKKTFSKDNTVLLIPGFMSRSFVSYCSMRGDLLLIKQYLDRMEKENDQVVTSAYTYSTISLYGKCFTDSSKGRAPKLEPNELFEDGEELTSTHEYLMNLRHNFIAHRGDTDSEVEVAYIIFPNEGDESQVRYTRNKQLLFSEDERRKIQALLDYLIEKLMEKIVKSAIKTKGAMFNNFTPDHMKFMLINDLDEESII